MKLAPIYECLTQYSHIHIRYSISYYTVYDVYNLCKMIKSAAIRTSQTLSSFYWANFSFNNAIYQITAHHLTFAMAYTPSIHSPTIPATEHQKYFKMTVVCATKSLLNRQFIMMPLNYIKIHKFRTCVLRERELRTVFYARVVPL